MDGKDDLLTMSVFSGENMLCVRGGRVVFEGLDFSLRSGGALVLTGPNGSGKSSLLRMMAGLLKPGAGRLSWDGEPVAEDREAHNGRIHYIGHHDAVKSVLTVSENIRFWVRVRAGAKGFDGDIGKALEIFDIEKLRDAPGRFLSAGQKRRVNLCRLAAAPAPVWLLDEPWTALDKATVERLANLMAEHRADGGMVVLSTHLDIDIGDRDILDLSNFQVTVGGGFADSARDPRGGDDCRMAGAETRWMVS